MPSSNRSGTLSGDGASFHGCRVSSSCGSAARTPQCGPRNLYGEHRKTSAPIAAMSIVACAARCTPSTTNSAPAPCTASAIRGRSGRVPTRFDAPVTATRRVRSDSTEATSSSSAVSGSKSSHRTVAPADSAARTHGRTFASWSSRVTTISSPGDQVAASVRAMSNVSAVMLRPNTMPRWSAPSRSAIAARALTTIVSAACSPIVIEPRLARGEVMAAATAPATASGTWEPPGPSKCAIPARSEGNRARRAATS